MTFAPDAGIRKDREGVRTHRGAPPWHIRGIYWRSA